MAASSNGRKPRYQRDAAAHGQGLAPYGLQFVARVADLEPVTSTLLARDMGVSQKSLNRIGRKAFDAGFVERVAVPRSLLADPSGASSAALLFGSAPDIYVLSARGIRLLYEQGQLPALRPVKQYGPKSLSLAHTLLVREVQVWLSVASRTAEDEELAVWRDASETVIELRSPGGPKRLIPDALFIYRVGSRSLICTLEADRGTERGNHGRWSEKLASYEAFFRGGYLQSLVGFTHGRVIVVTPGPLRRDGLCRFVEERAPAFLAERFWFAERSVLSGSDLGERAWRRPGQEGLLPLLDRAAL